MCRIRWSCEGLTSIPQQIRWIQLKVYLYRLHVYDLVILWGSYVYSTTNTLDKIEAFIAEDKIEAFIAETMYNLLPLNLMCYSTSCLCLCNYATGDQLSLVAVWQIIIIIIIIIISGGSRISLRRGCQLSRGGTNIRFCQIFPKTAPIEIEIERIWTPTTM